MSGSIVVMGGFRKGIKFALRSNPTPDQSGFKVGSAAMTASGLFVSGSNHEYAITRAIHSEESLVANVLERVGPSDKIVNIFIVAGDPGNVATPCGNCRDILREYISPDASIVSASEKGGRAILTSFKRYLFEDFSDISLEQLKGLPEWNAIDLAEIARSRSYNLYSSRRGIYGATVFTADETFMGGFEGDVSYHPSYPIANAISNFFYAGDNPRRFSSVKGLVISAADQRPEVPYKDRQTFMEFAARIRAFKGDSPPIPIYLVEAHQYTPIRAWKTNDEEWLPLPFNPKNLGMQHMLKDSITKLLPE